MMQPKWKNGEHRLYTVTTEYEVTDDVGLGSLAQLAEESLETLKTSDNGEALIVSARVLSVEEVFDDAED